MKKMKSTILQTNGLCKKYGTFSALKPFDMELHAGDIYALVGKNGAGKTTFLKLITGQVMPTEGFLTLFGKVDPKEIEKERKKMNVTILISSHILSEAEELATRFAFIHQGEVLKELTKEQLNAESKKYLEVTVDNPERALVALERECKDAVYKALPDRKIQIQGYLEQGDLITATLLKHDVKVFSLQVQGGNLEDYFMTMIGR